MGRQEDNNDAGSDVSLVRSRAAAIIVAVGFGALIPPVAIDGRYSIMEVALLVLSASLVVALPRGRWSAPAVPLGFVFLMLTMLASAVWSVESWNALRDGSSYVLLALSAWLLIARVGVTPVVVGIAGAVTAIASISVVYWFIDPAAATFYESTGLQGIYGNRNTLGFVLVGGLPAVLALATPRRRWLVLKIATVLFIGAVAIATTSQTATFVTLIVIATGAALALSRRLRIALPLFGVLIAMGAVVAAVNLDRLLDLIGKSSTLNGRTLIWEATFAAGLQSPVFGYGWSRSWQPGSPHSVAVSEQLDGHVVFHAHNELLNWFVTLGGIGVVAVIVAFTTTAIFAIAGFRAVPSAVAMWPILTLVAIVARGLTEISETNAQGWFVLSLAVFAATRLGYGTATAPARRLVVVPGRAQGSVSSQ